MKVLNEIMLGLAFFLAFVLIMNFIALCAQIDLVFYAICAAIIYAVVIYWRTLK
jgi:hypothetical protein